MRILDTVMQTLDFVSGLYNITISNSPTPPPPVFISGYANTENAFYNQAPGDSLQLANQKTGFADSYILFVSRTATVVIE